MQERHLEQSLAKSAQRAIDAVDYLKGLEQFTIFKRDGSEEVDTGIGPEVVDEQVGRRIQGAVSQALAGVDPAAIYDRDVQFEGISRWAFMVGETGFACLAPRTEMGLIELVTDARTRPRKAIDSDWKLISGQLIATFRTKVAPAQNG